MKLDLGEAGGDADDEAVFLRVDDDLGAGGGAGAQGRRWEGRRGEEGEGGASTLWVVVCGHDEGCSAMAA